MGQRRRAEANRDLLVRRDMRIFKKTATGVKMIYKLSSLVFNS